MAQDDTDPEKTGPDALEPEGAPDDRARSFLQERMTPIRRKSDLTGRAAETTTRSTPPPSPADPPTPRPPAPPGAPSAAERSDDEGPEEPGPGPDRRTLIEEFRNRQLRQTSPGRVAPEFGAPEVPPEAPVPPPANNWVPIGPSVLRQGQGGVQPATSGRTPAIGVAPGGNRAYIGAANGGVWRTLDGGDNWVSLMDSFDLNPTLAASDSLACGALALVPGATAAQDRLYVGSGDGASGAYFGVGPVISTDGGANWATEPVAPGSPALAGSAFFALAVDPADPDRVVGACRNASGAFSAQDRIYRREPDGSGGFHWAQKSLPGNGHQWITSVVVARAGGTTTFYAAGYFGPVFSSTDGHTWATVGAGFPNDARVGRISLACQPDSPTVVYALVSLLGNPTAPGQALSGNLHGLYRLDTADGTWRTVTGVPNTLFSPTPLTRNGQGGYDNAIAVAPDNVNRVYVGGSTAQSGGEWSGSLYRLEITVSGGGTTVSAAPTYIGGSVHADIHKIEFTPGDADDLWVGCDGGVFRSDNPTGSGNIFASVNKGLQTLTLNYLGQHPTEDAVLFSGTQDNGGDRFTGEEAWLYTSGGDSGYFVVNWDDPYRVLDTYVRGTVRRSTDGGTRYSYSQVNVPLVNTSTTQEAVLFYAPIAGTPPNPGAPAEANIVAFGSERPWISTTFGGNWQSIPNNTLAGDSLGDPIKSMVFASATKLYAGTMGGRVYRFDKPGVNWTRSRLDTMGGANDLPLIAPITAIAVDPADGTGNSIYITLGGNGDFRHVWHFNGTQWAARSGPSAVDPDALLDVQHNTIVVDPMNVTQIYVGADIGVWRSTDSGATWAVFSEGLPDAAVLDFKLHNPRRILRASTHGRGAFERTLANTPMQGVELYVRDTQLDQGRFTTVNFLPDPTDQGETVRHWRGPDIKLDTPDVSGDYQFPLASQINFLDFVDTLNDDSRTVATHATATITTRVYVQVHNRGVIPANNVRVMCLLANASAGLPNLPPGYEANVQNGTPITTPDWETLGIVDIDDVRVGFPKIAAFDLTSNKLPPPANLAGNDHHCVLALVHHAADPYTSTQTNTDQNSKAERKSAHKNLKVVQFTGTPPAPPPVVIPFRLHAGRLDEKILSDIWINLQGYRGRVRLYLPRLEADGDLRERAKGLFAEEDFEDFKLWAEKQHKFIRANLESKHRFHKTWSKQRLEDIEAALENGFMFTAGGKRQVGLTGLILEPERHYALFLVLDRPENGRIGEAFDLEIVQTETRERTILGGLDLRIELQPEPKEIGVSPELGLV